MAQRTTTTPYLSAAYQERVRPCIDLVDSLRRIGLDKDVDLPAVVVIGDQSVGKSSVLEAISGVKLPRGTEIVTRCPVELRLKTLDEGDWRGRIHYTSFSKSIDKNIVNEDDVDDEIREAQNKITDSQRGISDTLITVEMESVDVPNLTLIDLPGIARVALAGQPDNIAEMIKTLLKKFIAKEETIILCVIPCNVDIATTEALKMAQEVDPTGSRTLGVLTKPDLVDLGTEPNVVKIAQNKVIPLKKGYTVIKCRGQKNVESKQPLQEAMDEEDRFFKEHRIYNVLYHEKCAGTRVLANKLTSELVEQIRKSVPQLQRGIKDKLEETKQELFALGDTVPDDKVERVNLLVRELHSSGTKSCAEKPRVSFETMKEGYD
ncbi:interferon-induced GTP-binding protein Mx-like [Ptychodera flava]|uniref:interferon-induced GTP-binding protein Mx-like n=1 Tax=Ptychodera flava TaxID=63121 RepID=UPI00396A0A71